MARAVGREGRNEQVGIGTKMDDNEMMRTAFQGQGIARSLYFLSFPFLSLSFEESGQDCSESIWNKQKVDRITHFVLHRV
jgi:hypothetical protein